MGYYQFVKAYSNYYVPNEADENLQFGVSFTIPSYSAFIFDISKDSEKINYQVSYSPYSVLSLKILRRDFSANEAIDDTVSQGLYAKAVRRTEKEGSPCHLLSYGTEY